MTVEVDSPIDLTTDDKQLLLPYLLCTAASKGDLDSVKRLVEEKKMDVNVADYDGRTALHLAAEEGHLHVLKYLLEKGADINVEDRWGTVPLRGAISFNRNETAAFLKESGARLTYSTKRSEIGEKALAEEEKKEELKNLFKAIEPEGNGLTVSIKAVTKFLQSRGILRKKVKVLDEQLKALEAEGKTTIDFKQFDTLMHTPNQSIFLHALQDNLVVPNWKSFCKDIEAVFESCRKNDEGKQADYIPELAEADGNLFGLVIITVDGQILTLGDYETEFSIQSCGKPLQYSVAAEEIGIDNIHKYVGQEPSGVAFNAFTLNSQKKPHNPLINSGAIMTSSLFHPELPVSKRFKMLTQKFSELAGGEKIGFSQSVYLSEKGVAHRNFALAHFMRAEGGFPPDCNILEAVDFYFQMCSCEVNCFSLAAIASTYANNGRNPLSNKKVLSSPIVKHTLQLMYSCGMYDFSGEWACTIGLPAKSGVAGGLMVVIPEVMGIALYSPRLDSHGNSVRAQEFCRKFVEKFNWSLFDVLFSGKYEK